MRSRRHAREVYSLSAIDLFASAMGAFLIISIILMPDYQKEVRSQLDLEYLEELAGKTDALLQETETGSEALLDALLAAQTRQQALQAEHDEISGELAVLQAELQARNDQPPPPPPTPEPVSEEESSNRVTFRFLGLKTDRKRILFLVDMNRYLATHEALVRKTVERGMESLGAGYQFAILGFQQQDSGPRYWHWPDEGKLANMNSRNRAEAIRFLDGLAGHFGGSSSLLGAFERAFGNPADAIILISDGLPNPEFNGGLSPGRLVRSITLSNTQGREIHAVTVGDYFKYRGTVEFMESLARANSGGFLALAD